MAVALSHNDERVNDFFNAQRKSKGVYIIPLGKAVRQCLSVLKDNRILALVGDRDFAERGMILPFFGRPAHFPEGPAAFALKTGAPIVPGFTLRNPDDTFTLRFEKPIECILSGNTEKDTREIIMRYKEVMEAYIKKYPDQWYMFKHFWIDPPNQE
jgi:KDO2-lipid IV(A) lauroyltransferase